MARFGGHGENSTVPTTEYNIELLCRAGKSQHLMRLPPDVISLEQPLELLGGQHHHFPLKQPWPDKPLPALDHLVYDDKAVAAPVKDLHGVMTATDEAVRQRRDRPSSLPGRAQQGSSAPCDYAVLRIRGRGSTASAHWCRRCLARTHTRGRFLSSGAAEVTG